MHTLIVRLQRSCTLAACLILAYPVAAEVIPIIDTHAHINFAIAPGQGVQMNFPGSIEAAMSRMDNSGIQQSIFMPLPSFPGARNSWEIDTLEFAREKYPGRIALIGGGGTLNPMIQAISADAVDDATKRRFREIAEKIAESKAVAFGEITSHHLSLQGMGQQHGYQVIPADHPLLLLLADIAGEKGMPIDLHIDLVPEDMDLPNRHRFNNKTPERLKENLQAFERLLSHNRKANIVWAHAGLDPLETRNVSVQRQLLQKHPNLYMSLRVGGIGPAASFILDEDRIVKPEWLSLLQEFPDRFTIGTDYLHGPEGMPERGQRWAGLRNYQIMLKQLPTPLAESIAYKNAERLYGVRLPSPRK